MEMNGATRLTPKEEEIDEETKMRNKLDELEKAKERYREEAL